MDDIDQMLSEIENPDSQPTVIRRQAPARTSMAPGDKTFSDARASTVRSPASERQVSSPPVWRDSSKQDPNAVNCNECQKRIFLGQDAFQAGGQVYCLDCLCGACGNPFRGRPAKPGPNGRRYCPECVCASCGGAITEKFVRDGQNKVCLNCICSFCRGPLRSSDRPPLCNNCRCAHCGTGLEGRYFPGDAGQRLCEPCANGQRRVAAGGAQAQSSQGPPCSKCGTAITGQYMDWEGRKYHTMCFTCVDCGNSGAQILGGQIYCNSCHPDKEVCCVCKQGLRGTGLEALGRLYHERCFTCQRCNGVLPDGRFKELDGFALCTHCAIEVVESNITHQ